MTSLATTPLDAALAGMPVQGRNLRPGPLGAQLGPDPALLVFLRHLG
jgi:hypothetical protein